MALTTIPRSNFTDASRRVLYHAACDGVLVLARGLLACETCGCAITDAREITGHPAPEIVREPRPWSPEAQRS